MLMLGHLTQMAGFIISPCRLYPMQDESVFENVCLGLATGQLFTFVGAFTWKFLDHICIHLTITRVGINQILSSSLDHNILASLNIIES